VLEVHPPHSSIHGWRDFSIHLATITMGLLIALGLEGCVEWLQHRHVMHQAQKSLQIEITANAGSMQARLDGLQKQQQDLKQDVDVLTRVIANPDAPIHGSLDLRLDITDFDNVSWTTAQSTGAMALMPYATAREYSDIYGEQTAIDAQMQLAVRDLSVALGPLLNAKSRDSLPDAEDAKLMKHNIEILQGQLYLVDSLLKTMDKTYKKFLESHPNPY
jgi:hypothetical protein